VRPSATSGNSNRRSAAGSIIALSELSDSMESRPKLAFISHYNPTGFLILTTHYLKII
jgi:hypothetical protein